MEDKYSTAEEAIAAAKTSAADIDFIEFDGWNCEDIGNECEGWDGWDRRCDCGNRRVAWDAYKNDDGTYTALAVAY